MIPSIATTTSRVVIHDSHTEPVVSVAVQLLNVLGHDVALTESADAAISLAMESRTELLVLSLTDHDEQCAALDRLAMLPASARPRQVAILSDDETDSSIPPMQRKLPGVRVHLFVRAIHAHGLLKVIKRIASLAN